jgi:hypothetical protein
VGPRAVLDSVVKRKIPSPRRESNPRTPIISIRLSYHDSDIITYLREIVRKGVDWIHLAQDRDQWRAPVSKVVSLRVPKQGDSLLTG